MRSKVFDTLIMRHEWTIEIKFGNGWKVVPGGTDREHVAFVMRLAREHGLEYRLTHEVRTWWTEVTMCAGCLAREPEWDNDCDGPYQTSSCGVCDWPAAFNARHVEFMKWQRSIAL